jgi:hypothetical protein
MFLVFNSNNHWSPSPPVALVLRISHSGSLPCRPPRSILHISHFSSLTRRAPLLGPLHFPLRFFNLSIPPPGPSHFPLQFFNLSVPVLENPIGTKEPSVPFISTTLSSLWFSWKNCHYVGRFFDFVIILKPITMYHDYLNCPWPLSVWLQGKLL